MVGFRVGRRDFASPCLPIQYLAAIGQGIPANIAHFVLEWVHNMGDGEWEEQTKDLETLIGRKATTPTEFFRDGYLPK